MPERIEKSFWIDGDTLRSDPVPNAELVVDGGWLLPGLVDVHTHPGTESSADTFSEAMLRRHLVEHRDAGVLALRTPGTASRLPAWVADDEELPRVRSAGRWLAAPGRFFPGYGHEVSEDDMVAAAVAEAQASDGWCKVIGDFRHHQAPVRLEVLSAVIAAVHAAGGRVAVHCQTAQGCHNAVMAGADSLEHGMHLDPALLNRMAEQGTALVPTLTAFGDSIDQVRSREPSPARDWLLSGWERMLPTVRSASESGVKILAGTDSLPFGSVAGEVEWLVRAGLSGEEALGAASWVARSWLGLSGLADGGYADVVAYDTDPTVDIGALRHPTRIIMRGRIIR